MNITFKATALLDKPWTFEDSGITYIASGIVTNINFEDVIDFLVLSEPDKRKNGELQLLTQDGRSHRLLVHSKQREDWGKALHHIETHIRKRGLKKDANADGILYDIASCKVNFGKSLTVFEDRVILKDETKVTTGFSGGEKTIYYTDCVGVQFRETSLGNPGYLQLETASAMVVKSENPFLDENTFPFERRILNPYIREVADCIRAKVEACKGQKNSQAVPASAADELKKFKDLLDMGVITQEEFDAKKKQLLGL